MKTNTLLCSLLISSFVTAIACGAAEESGGALTEEADSIRGGRVDRGHPAVGLIGQASSTSALADTEWICTGTLIAPRVVVTAAHCMYGRTHRRVAASRMRFTAGDQVFRATRARVAPAYAPNGDFDIDDLAVLTLDRAPAVEPIGIAKSEPLEGDRAVVVGFGVTSADAPGRGTGAGVKRRATIHIDALSDRELEYDASDRGACYGDSGGPVLQNLHDGNGEVVIGVTSRGSNVACDGIDVATRVDVFTEWIAE